jgi:hypothetical protein
MPVVFAILSIVPVVRIFVGLAEPGKLLDFVRSVLRHYISAEA